MLAHVDGLEPEPEPDVDGVDVLGVEVEVVVDGVVVVVDGVVVVDEVDALSLFFPPDDE